MSLMELMPKFDEKRHGTYARTLYDACNPRLAKRHVRQGEEGGVSNANIETPRNVSLMGSFGVGKSSIIQGFESYVRYEFRCLTRLGVPSLYTWKWFAEKIIKRKPSGKAYILQSDSIQLSCAIIISALYLIGLIIATEQIWLLRNALIVISFIVSIIAGAIIVALLLIWYRKQCKNIPRYIKVSLLSFDPTNNIVDDDTTDDAHKKNDESMTDTDHGSAALNKHKTLEVQGEVVRQLIYGVSQRIVDMSHFHRLRTWHSFRERLSIVYVTVPSCALLMSIGLMATRKPTIADLYDLIHDSDNWKHSPWLLFILIAVPSAICLGFILKDHMQLGKIQADAGGVSLTYEDTRANRDYFDKYLDEIIFLIEKAKIRYVVFEDLDRANDMHIFYELRNLNMLINSSARKNRQIVTFIYAMGDDSFESARMDGYDTAESKAKFFDVNIYVRPFISICTGAAVLQNLFLVNNEK